METDVLFVSPGNSSGIYQGLSGELSAIEPPTWALLLAEAVRAKGFKPKILDLNAEHLDTDQIILRIKQLKPRLICFVVYGQNVNSGTTLMSGAVLIAEAMKKNLSIPISLIGSYVQALPKKTLEDEKSFDFGFTNEGVYSLLSVLALKDFGYKNLKSIKGLVIRNGDQIQITPAENVVPTERMDQDLPGYAWDLLPYNENPLDLYRSPLWHADYDPKKRTPYAAIQTSLGCNFGCSFCMINIINRNNENEIGVASDYSRMRFWSPEFMIKQFDILAQMGVRTIRIVDEMFLLNRKYYVPLCEGLAKKSYAKELRMWAYSRVDTVSNPQFLALVRSAGIKWLALGIESASKSTRLEVSKGKFEDVEIKRVISQVHDAGLEVMANYIVGLPGEDLAKMEDTLKLSLELCTSGWNMYAAMALPGSELYKESLTTGKQLPKSYIEYSFHSYESQPMSTTELSSAEILDFRDKAFKIYHSDPNFISRINEKFSSVGVDTIANIVKIPLKRKILGD